jgi:hypothetical protein
MLRSRYSRRILMKLEFSRQIFRKILEYKFSRKSVQWDPRFSMRAGGRADRLIVFRNFANAPKRLCLIPQVVINAPVHVVISRV